MYNSLLDKEAIPNMNKHVSRIQREREAKQQALNDMHGVFRKLLQSNSVECHTQTDIAFWQEAPNQWDYKSDYRDKELPIDSVYDDQLKLKDGPLNFDSDDDLKE